MAPSSTAPPTEVPDDEPGFARGLSIRVKLFLFVEGLLAIATIAYSIATYREMRGSAIAAASTRIEGIATQWATLFDLGRVPLRALASAVEASPAMVALLSRPDSSVRRRAGDILPGLLPKDPQRALVQIIAADGREVLRFGDAAPWATVSETRALLAQAATADSGALGSLRVIGDSVVYASAARIVVAGQLRGFVVQWRRVGSKTTRDQLSRLLGVGTRIYAANRTNDVWTDFGQQVAAPRVDLLAATGVKSYDRPGVGAVFGIAKPISGSPWAVAIEMSQQEVLAQARGFLIRLLLIGALVIALGAVAAIVLSVSFVRPLLGLMAAAERVAAGDYSVHSGLARRGDELGRLARVFDMMVSHVQESFMAREAAERYYRHLFESVPLPLWVYDVKTLRILAVNETAIGHYGYNREEFLTLTIADIRPPEDVPRLRRAVREHGDAPADGTWRHKTRDGTLIDVETRARSIDFGGRHARIVIIHDLTERHRAQQVIRTLDERYTRLIRESMDGVTLSTLDGRIISANPAFVQMMGYASEADVLTVPAAAIYAGKDERALMMAKLAVTGTIRREKSQFRRKDGALIDVLFTSRVATDPDTTEQYLECVVQDVTELRRVERQFQQAQKMEAVGQLAGGVAHDFNNLLTVIISYTDLALEQIQPGDVIREDLEAIRHAGTSAAGLTRQLLTFSRQEVRQPKIVRLNDSVAASGKMLARLIGEHIELATALDRDAGAVNVDIAQIEQVIVNLAVNARDAMPNGGRLLIESKNVEFNEALTEHSTLYPAGSYVLLAVSDNGTGMDAATLEHVFEPFFTTKEPGRGTGLGLSTVYGIVKQSGGYISVYSEPGSGTSFKIYLPRVAEQVVSLERPATGVGPARAETLLVVEDDAAVRRLARRVLELQGYRVLEAPDGETALTIASSHEGEIHLLFTDVVMPRMSGGILATQFALLRPDARILFASGYTSDAIVHHGVLEQQMQFIEKPFTKDSLLRRIREVLDAPPLKGVADGRPERTHDVTIPPPAKV